jgi:hypothetical protein
MIFRVAKSKFANAEDDLKKLASKRRTKLCSVFLDMLEIAVSIVNATKRVNLQTKQERF